MGRSSEAIQAQRANLTRIVKDRKVPPAKAGGAFLIPTDIPGRDARANRGVGPVNSGTGFAIWWVERSAGGASMAKNFNGSVSCGQEPCL